jgi:hypothetical protein
MSQDKIGPLVRALVGVPKKRLGLLLNIANIFKSEGERGQQFYSFLSNFVRERKSRLAVPTETKAVESVPRWREEDGVIRFSVTSDGTIGEDWIARLKKKGFRVGDYAKQLLLSDEFKPTSGVTHEVAVLKGMLFSDNDRITSKVRAEATCRNLSVPKAEVACLIREKFTDKELEAMGLWLIIVMHEPIKNSDGSPRLLDVTSRGDGS